MRFARLNYSPKRISPAHRWLTKQKWRADFGAELKRASQMRRRFYGNFWGAPFTDRMIGFARGHRGIRRVLGQLVAGDQGYTDLKKKLARSALKP